MIMPQQAGGQRRKDGCGPATEIIPVVVYSATVRECLYYILCPRSFPVRMIVGSRVYVRSVATRVSIK